VGPHVVAHGDDLVHNDPRSGALSGDLSEELTQGYGPVRDQRVVLDVPRPNEFGRTLLGLLRVDHQLVELEDVVLVADGAAVVGVEDLDHELLLFVAT
jgi:hypothetical protein